MDEGWTRWVLEQYEFPFTRVSGADIQAGSLRDRIDVLVVTDEPQGVLPGRRRARRAVAVAAAPRRIKRRRTTRGLPRSRRSSARAVRSSASTAALPSRSRGSKLPVKDVTAGLDRQSFFAGTSLLNVVVDPGQRVMAGMPERATVFFSSSPAFETLDGFNGTVLARYPDSEVLASGFLLGEPVLARQGRGARTFRTGTAASSCSGSVPSGAGSPFGTFRVIFNALLSGV